jgi:Bacterial regulatory proteins, tetR family
LWATADLALSRNSLARQWNIRNDVTIIIYLKVIERSVTIDSVREAALDVFLDKGYRQASMADVAGRAEVSEAEVRQVAADKEVCWRSYSARGMTTSRHCSTPMT